MALTKLRAGPIKLVALYKLLKVNTQALAAHSCLLTARGLMLDYLLL